MEDVYESKWFAYKNLRFSQDENKPFFIQHFGLTATDRPIKCGQVKGCLDPLSVDSIDRPNRSTMSTQ